VWRCRPNACAGAQQGAVTAMCCEDELHGDVVASGIVLGRDVGEEAC
jgi:hypothetical protein